MPGDPTKDEKKEKVVEKTTTANEYEEDDDFDEFPASGELLIS